MRRRIAGFAVFAVFAAKNRSSASRSPRKCWKTGSLQTPRTAGRLAVLSLFSAVFVITETQRRTFRRNGLRVSSCKSAYRQWYHNSRLIVNFANVFLSLLMARRIVDAGVIFVVGYVPF